MGTSMNGVISTPPIFFGRRGSGLCRAVLCLWIVFHGFGAAAQSETDLEAFGEYRGSDDFKAMHMDATKWMLKNLMPYGCKSIQVLDGGMSSINILRPVEFDDDTGEPESGKWRETTRFVACGRRSIQHIDFEVRGPGDVRAINMAPGDSVANHLLQRDVYFTLRHVFIGNYKQAKSAAGMDDKGSCDSIRLIDTEMLTSDPPSPLLKWQERWHVDYCGRVVKTEIQFETTPGVGTTFKVGP